MIEKNSKQAAQSCAAFVQESRTKIQSLQSKLQRLLDSSLDQDIDIEREIYLEKKAQFMSDKKSLEERIIKLEQKQTGWLEPHPHQPPRPPCRGGKWQLTSGKALGGALRRPCENL